MAVDEALAQQLAALEDEVSELRRKLAATRASVRGLSVEANAAQDPRQFDTVTLNSAQGDGGVLGILSGIAFGIGVCCLFYRLFW